MTQQVLVIDDEISIRRILKLNLESHGFQVLEAGSGTEGITQLREGKPHIIILDLGLPDRPGLSVLKDLREWSKVPVIVLTVTDSEEEKVKLLDAGADDYLTKPFSVPELLARMRVAIRHSHAGQVEPVFKSGDLEIDFSSRIVKVRGQEVKMTATEYSLLKMLALNAGKIVTQAQILNDIWGPNSVEHSQYLRVYIGHLRKKIELNPATPTHIITEAGVGYRLKI